MIDTFPDLPRPDHSHPNHSRPDTGLGAPLTRHRLLMRISCRQDVEAGLAPCIALAAALHSELSALFVEEAASIDACALPFATVMGFSGQPIDLDAGGIQAALRWEAEACRRLLARAAETARLSWSFQSSRGDALRLLQERSVAGDIVVLRHDRLGPQLDDLLSRLRQLAPAGGGVLALPAQPAPARAQGTVLTFDRAATAPASLRPVAGRMARALGAAERHAAIPEGASAAELAARLAGARLLLARVDSPLFDDPALLRRLSGMLRMPLLLLRDGD